MVTLLAVVILLSGADLEGGFTVGVYLAIILLKIIMNFSLSIVYMISNNTNTHKLT